MSYASFTRRYTKGNTARVTVSTVREDTVDHRMESPVQLWDFWKYVIATQPDYEPEKECLIVVLLNTKLHAFAWNRVSLGTIDQTYAHPREIFRPVIAGGAWAFALMHNHPSGDPTPSPADSKMTTRIRECAELMQIKFVDHVIVGMPGDGRLPYYSFREAGCIA